MNSSTHRLTSDAWLTWDGPTKRSSASSRPSPSAIFRLLALAQQLRQLALPIEEPASRAILASIASGRHHVADPVAENVNGFLVDGRFLPGLEQGISSTYLLLDDEVDPPLLGYVTLTFDSVRLTNAEKRQMQDLLGIAEFGALRIQMIGIDRRHQGKGLGTALLEAITAARSEALQ